MLVATDETGQICGGALTSMRPELLTHAPSAHLQALVVAESAEGYGVGRSLIDHTEQMVLARGAQSITLHVFGNNTRARSLYQRAGYNEELIRAIKHF